MRMYEWTADMIRFMRDASEQTDFYEKLADEIVLSLGGAQAVKPMRLCDAGCGLGYLSLALSARCKSVTAVDISAPAMDVLKQNIARCGVSNVEPLQTDLWRLPGGERFDAMVFCLFGRLPDVLEVAGGRCERLVVVKKNWTTRRFAMKPDRPERDTLDETVRELTARGVACAPRVVPLCLHQPFRSLEDAMTFFRIYGDEPSEVDENEVRHRLVANDSKTFPWLLPVPRELGILTITLPVPERCFR